WGANQNGIFYFSKIKNQFINSPTPPLASGSQKPFVGKRQLAEDAEGNIWVTAGLGHLGRVSPNGDLSKPIELLKLDKNLPNIAVLAALINKNGDLWLGSTEGLTRIRLRTGQVTQYGKSYGIETVYGLGEAADGEIFAATQGGFYRFYPDKLNVEIKPPKPLIANFKVFDQPFTTKLGSIASEKIRLSHRQNFFSFEFSALDFSSNDEKEFAYMLEGLEADWVMAGSRRYAAYTNLWGGDYLFKMRVRNKYGDWSEPVTLPIYIVPPVWQRWWFWVMAALLATAIIYVIYRYRITQIRREAALKMAFNKQLAEVEMKALRAQMNPHFLFNSLNAIKFYVLKKDKKKAAEYLTDFSRLIRLVLHNSSLQLISLEKELEALELYMRIEQLRFDEQFDFEIKIAPDVATDAFLLPPLLLQPYVENAIWHGLMHKKDGKGLLLVKVDKIENGFSCIMEDNGIGREKAWQVRSKSASAQKSMGMSITRHRMDISKILTNTDFEVAVEDLVDPSGEAAGTRVVIRARFREAF
ncbi:MAG TPA: histidine kinase, partial [Saprospiraceae bacterium]|nr:histidine kinase [Saprospiraceae bacterium]